MKSSNKSVLDSQLFQCGEMKLVLNDIAHWVRIEGVSNQTTPIVIVHGGPGGHNYTFERTIGPLIERFATVVYYEQRGCGRSEAPKNHADYELPALLNDLDELRKALELEKMTLLGYSFGAELSLRYAKQHPNNVQQLILSSPAELSTQLMLVQIQGFYSIADAEFRKLIEGILVRGSSIEEKLLEIWNHAEQSVIDRFLFKNMNAAKLNRRLWEESNLPHEGDPHFQNVILATSKGDLLNVVSGLQTQCLIICGIHDKNGGFHCGKDLVQVLPHSELKLYENSAHFPDIEESERFAADVARAVGTTI
jgi:proline iminopeptidase